MNCDELAQALVELVHHIAVKTDAVVEQPVEGFYRDFNPQAMR
jgi:hypothetical protein